VGEKGGGRRLKGVLFCGVGGGWCFVVFYLDGGGLGCWGGGGGGVVAGERGRAS